MLVDLPGYGYAEASKTEIRRWTALMRDWNAQPIFGGHVMPREERDFSRAELVRQLRELAGSDLRVRELVRLAGQPQNVVS